MADARKDKRTLLSLRIRYKSATLEDFIERYSSDISRGGVFIKAKKPLAVGTLLKFEFILQDHSTLIHGVGRVIWRRDEAETDAENPPGMGIKFIKMDSESRAVVQRIAEGRGRPGVFEQGKEGSRLAPAAAPDSGALAETDPTKVRHVSEFLASALEEGGASEVATREAQAGAEHARQASNQLGDTRAAAARGAFSAHHELPTKKRHTVSDSPSRGAMSAFGGAGMSASASMGSAAAPAINELNAEDDFLDDETTKIRDFAEYDYSETSDPASDYPDADPTVVTAEAASAFAAEKRATPVVASPSSSPLNDAVPDLFASAAGDSLGPVSGEPIRARLLDPAAPGVPPPGAPVPDAPGIPAEAFKVPQAPEPVWTMRPTPEKPRSRGWMLSLLFVLFLAAGALAAWQLGLMDGWMDPAAPTAQPEQASVEPQPVKKAVAVVEVEPVQAAEPAVNVEDTEVAPVEVAEISIVKFEVLSRPVGAMVSVDGKSVGRTPLELEYEAGAKLSLFSKARGYLPRRQRITVQADQAPVKLWLAPLPYVVQVITNPAGASASAVGGGQVATPGALRFKSMPGPREIVVSMDGYKTATRSVARDDFTEETRRMAATVNVTLQKDGAAEPAQAASSTEAVTPPPNEVKAKAEPSAEPSVEPSAGPSVEPPPAEPPAEPPPAPKAVETPPTSAPSETTPADAP